MTGTLGCLAEVVDAAFHSVLPRGKQASRRGSRRSARGTLGGGGGGRGAAAALPGRGAEGGSAGGGAGGSSESSSGVQLLMVEGERAERAPPALPPISEHGGSGIGTEAEQATAVGDGAEAGAGRAEEAGVRAEAEAVDRGSLGQQAGSAAPALLPGEGQGDPASTSFEAWRRAASTHAAADAARGPGGSPGSGSPGGSPVRGRGGASSGGAASSAAAEPAAEAAVEPPAAAAAAAPARTDSLDLVRPRASTDLEAGGRPALLTRAALESLAAEAGDGAAGARAGAGGQLAGGAAEDLERLSVVSNASGVTGTSGERSLLYFETHFFFLGHISSFWDTLDRPPVRNSAKERLLPSALEAAALRAAAGQGCSSSRAPRRS